VRRAGTAGFGIERGRSFLAGEGDWAPLPFSRLTRSGFPVSCASAFPAAAFLLPLPSCWAASAPPRLFHSAKAARRPQKRENKAAVRPLPNETEFGPTSLGARIIAPARAAPPAEGEELLLPPLPLLLPLDTGQGVVLGAGGGASLPAAAVSGAALAAAAAALPSGAAEEPTELKGGGLEAEGHGRALGGWVGLAAEPEDAMGEPVGEGVGGADMKPVAGGKKE
jgi:hypothetical protein